MTAHQHHKYVVGTEIGVIASDDLFVVAAQLARYHGPWYWLTCPTNPKQRDCVVHERDLRPVTRQPDLEF